MTDEGVKGFLVEKEMPGFNAQEIHNKFSLRASVTAALFFDNVRIPSSNVLPGIVGMKGPLSCLKGNIGTLAFLKHPCLLEPFKSRQAYAAGWHLD